MNTGEYVSPQHTGTQGCKYVPLYLMFSLVSEYAGKVIASVSGGYKLYGDQHFIAILEKLLSVIIFWFDIIEAGTGKETWLMWTVAYTVYIYCNWKLIFENKSFNLRSFSGIMRKAKTFNYSFEFNLNGSKFGSQIDHFYVSVTVLHACLCLQNSEWCTTLQAY